MLYAKRFGRRLRVVLLLNTRTNQYVLLASSDQYQEATQLVWYYHLRFQPGGRSHRVLHWAKRIDIPTTTLVVLATVQLLALVNFALQKLLYIANKMENEIEGKVVAITGASSGIGEAVALLLAKRGAKVVLGARRSDRLVALEALIKSAGGDAVHVLTDVKRRSDLVGLVELACERYGRLDVMINNAGMSQLSRIDALDVDGWEEMIDVNLKGVLYGIAAAIPAFQKQGSGHIINIISTSGIKIVPMQGVYAGTKNAVRTISEAIRQESGGRWRVTGISPGFVQTEFANNLKDPLMKAAVIDKMGSIAISPDAVARAVAFAIEQPADVELGDIVIRPTAQD